MQNPTHSKSNEPSIHQLPLFGWGSIPSQIPCGDQFVTKPTASFPIALFNIEGLYPALSNAKKSGLMILIFTPCPRSFWHGRMSTTFVYLKNGSIAKSRQRTWTSLTTRPISLYRRTEVVRRHDSKLNIRYSQNLLQRQKCSGVDRWALICLRVKKRHHYTHCQHLLPKFFDLSNFNISTTKPNFLLH